MSTARTTPGNGRCGGDSTGPVSSPAGELAAVTNWTEHGAAPATLLASRTDSSGAVTQTRPLRPYPDGAVYNGSGSIDDAAASTAHRHSTVLGR